jgi:hypothetical protein
MNMSCLRIRRAVAQTNVFFVLVQLQGLRRRLIILQKGSIAKITWRASSLVLRNQSIDGLFRYRGCSVTRGCTLLQFRLQPILVIFNIVLINKYNTSSNSAMLVLLNYASCFLYRQVRLAPSRGNNYRRTVRWFLTAGVASLADSTARETILLMRMSRQTSLRWGAPSTSL